MKTLPIGQPVQFFIKNKGTKQFFSRVNGRGIPTPKTILSPCPFYYFITDKFHWFILLKYQEIWQNHIIILTLLSTESQHPFKVEFQYCQSAFQTITDQQYPGFHNVA
jgi:hypothetical protein